MNSRTIRLITAGIAGAGAILSIGDKVTGLPLPGWLVSNWGLVIIAAQIFNAVGHALLEPRAAQAPQQPAQTVPDKALHP